MTAWLKLEPAQIEEADGVARMRQSDAEKMGRRGHNNAPEDRAAALALNVLGARGEIAGKAYLDPIEWHSLAAELGGVPDLGGFIDVKARRGENDDVILMGGRVRPDWAYLPIYCHKHPWYELLGWAWGRELVDQKWWRDPTGKRPAFFVPKGASVWRPMGELFEMTRRQYDKQCA